VVNKVLEENNDTSAEKTTAAGAKNGGFVQ
jgi:hypothetical protein